MSKNFAMFSASIEDFQKKHKGQSQFHLGVATDGSVVVYNLLTTAETDKQAAQVTKASVDSRPVEVVETIASLNSKEALKMFRVQGYENISREAKEWGAENVRAYTAHMRQAL